MTAPKAPDNESSTMKSAARRAYSTHQPKWQRFQSNLVIPTSQVGGDKNGPPNVYQRQYSHVYHQRLSVLGPRCWETMLPSDLPQVKRILELKEGTCSLVVGTLVRETTNEKEKPLHPDSDCRASDTLFLEDESGRVALEVQETHSYCTGAIVGLRGTVGVDGVMQVEQVFSPALAAPPSRMQTADESVAPCILLVSGLRCGGAEVSSVPRELLTLFLKGCFGTEKASRVSRVIVAGGLVDPSDIASPAECLRELDGFLLQLASAGLPVDVLPGQDDPTTANWPQRPLHSALLPRSSASSRVIRQSPNPYQATHHEQLVLGTDGRNVSDLTRRLLQKPNEKDDPKVPLTELEALQQTLEWNHICPNGPDSVPTVPHADADPMCMTQAPTVYFAGNAQQFGTSLVNGTRLICVPDFSKTGQAVLVNLESLDVEILRFEA